MQYEKVSCSSEKNYSWWNRRNLIKVFSKFFLFLIKNISESGINSTFLYLVPEACLLATELAMPQFWMLFEHFPHINGMKLKYLRAWSLMKADWLFSNFLLISNKSKQNIFLETWQLPCNFGREFFNNSTPREYHESAFCLGGKQKRSW